MRGEGKRGDLPSNHAQQETYEPHVWHHDGHFWVLILETYLRTSGNGVSSLLMVSKSNFILARSVA